MTDAWHNAFNETDAALGQVEGLGIALSKLVWGDFSSNDDASLALTALVNTINEKIAAVIAIRSAEFSAGNAVTRETQNAA